MAENTTIQDNLNSIKKETNSSLSSIIGVNSRNFESFFNVLSKYLTLVNFNEESVAMSMNDLILQTSLRSNGTVVVAQVDQDPVITLDNTGQISSLNLVTGIATIDKARLQPYSSLNVAGLPGEFVYAEDGPDGENLYYYNSVNGWTAVGSDSVISYYSADNGITIDSTVIKLGGDLIENTTITLDSGYTLIIGNIGTGAGVSFNQGEIGIQAASLSGDVSMLTVKPDQLTLSRSMSTQNIKIDFTPIALRPAMTLDANRGKLSLISSIDSNVFAVAKMTSMFLQLASGIDSYEDLPLADIDGSLYYSNSDDSFRGRANGTWKNFIMEGDLDVVPYNFRNGLTLAGNDVILGGVLTEDVQVGDYNAGSYLNLLANGGPTLGYNDGENHQIDIDGVHFRFSVDGTNKFSVRSDTGQVNVAQLSGSGTRFVTVLDDGTLSAVPSFSAISIPANQIAYGTGSGITSD